MIQCSACSSSEMEGSLFCSNCGASLLGQVTVGTTQSKVDLVTVIIDLPDQSRQIRLQGKDKYVIGRSISSRPTDHLDVDLNMYNGYEMGVSRQHAMIKITESGVVVVDLNSSNRSFIDNEEIFPGNEYNLPKGAVLRLGKLSMKISVDRSREGA